MRPKERRESGQNDLFRARLDQIVDVGPPACEARQGDRLAVSRGPVRSGLFGQSRASTAADAAHGGPGDSQVDARPVGRGPVRALDREPVLSAVLRRGVLPAQDAVRPLVTDALAPKDGRGEARRSDPGEPCDRDANRRGQAVGLFARHRRHDGAVEGGGVPDRRQAHAPGAGASGQAGEEDRRSPAPGL